MYECSAEVKDEQRKILTDGVRSGTERLWYRENWHPWDANARNAENKPRPIVRGFGT